jgi:hypothetical protein
MTFSAREEGGEKRHRRGTELDRSGRRQFGLPGPVKNEVPRDRPEGPKTEEVINRN